MATVKNTPDGRQSYERPTAPAYSPETTEQERTPYSSATAPEAKRLSLKGIIGITSGIIIAALLAYFLGSKTPQAIAPVTAPATIVEEQKPAPTIQPIHAPSSSGEIWALQGEIDKLRRQIDLLKNENTELKRGFQKQISDLATDLANISNGQVAAKHQIERDALAMNRIDILEKRLARISGAAFSALEEARDARQYQRSPKLRYCEPTGQDKTNSYWHCQISALNQEDTENQIQ